MSREGKRWAECSVTPLSAWLGDYNGELISIYCFCYFLFISVAGERGVLVGIWNWNSLG